MVVGIAVVAVVVAAVVLSFFSFLFNTLVEWNPRPTNGSPSGIYQTKNMAVVANNDGNTNTHCMLGYSTYAMIADNIPLTILPTCDTISFCTFILSNKCSPNALNVIALNVGPNTDNAILSNILTQYTNVTSIVVVDLTKNTIKDDVPMENDATAKKYRRSIVVLSITSPTIPFNDKSTIPRNTCDTITYDSLQPNPNKYISKNIPNPSPNSAKENAVHKYAVIADIGNIVFFALLVLCWVVRLFVFWGLVSLVVVIT